MGRQRLDRRLTSQVCARLLCANSAERGRYACANTSRANIFAYLAKHSARQRKHLPRLWRTFSRACLLAAASPRSFSLPCPNLATGRSGEADSATLVLRLLQQDGKRVIVAKSRLEYVPALAWSMRGMHACRMQDAGHGRVLRRAALGAVKTSMLPRVRLWSCSCHIADGVARGPETGMRWRRSWTSTSPRTFCAPRASQVGPTWTGVSRIRSVPQARPCRRVPRHTHANTHADTHLRDTRTNTRARTRASTRACMDGCGRGAREREAEHSCSPKAHAEGRSSVGWAGARGEGGRTCARRGGQGKRKGVADPLQMQGRDSSVLPCCRKPSYA
jgi:hypothetical protein